MKVFKGTDKNLRCRGFQFELGKTAETDDAKLCETGFHACECPLDVLRYYIPSGSRYFVADLDEVSDERQTTDTKVVGKKIALQTELSFANLCSAHFEYVKEHTTTEHTDPKRATTGDYGAATAGNYGAATTGDYGAATAGDYGAATAGNRGAATAGDHGLATAGYAGAATAGNYGLATAGDHGVVAAENRGVATAGYAGAATAGNRGVATAGNRGAATAGDYGAATAGNRGAATAGYAGAATSRGSAAVGENGCALVRGNRVKVKGGLGAVLVICEENDSGYNLKNWQVVVVDGETIKPDTWYSLSAAGELEEDTNGA